MKVIQLHYKTLRALLPFTREAEGWRDEIQGIRVISEPLSVTYVATDGKTLVARRQPLNERRDSEHERLETSLTIPLEVVEAAAKICDPEVAAGHMVPEIWITQDVAVGLAELHISRFGSITFAPRGKAYPDWRQILRLAVADGQASDLISVDGRYMARFSKLGRRLACGSMLVRNSRSGPMLVMFNEASNTVGAIMPIMSNRPSVFLPPQWATGDYVYAKPPE